MATAKTQRTQKSVAAGPDNKGLRIVAKRDRFRRAGYVFSGDPITLPLSELTPEQVEQLTEDPMLVVVGVDIEPAAET